MYAGITAHGATDLFFVTGTTGLDLGYKYQKKRKGTDGEDEHFEQRADGVCSNEYRDLLAGKGPFAGSPGLLAAGASIFNAAGIADWSFQQDNARIHFAGNTVNGKKTRAVIDAGAPHFVADWPDKGCDLSPIENAWRMTEWDMWANDSWSDFAGFKRALQRAWKRQTTTAKCKKLCMSFGRRLRLCIANGGDVTKY